MPLKTSTAEELPSVNMTPMIDIVFLLIIFFMVGTQFTQREHEIELKLPGVGGLKAMVTPPVRREVSVTADGTILFEGQRLTAAHLAQELKSMRARYPDLRISVRADAETRYQAVMTVLGAAQEAGVADIATAYRQSPTLR
ncbi:MAG: biopolymer transporter ExbD [Planctomycetales bacterium]|nr:biopolymer transporter ExbD [Planctomycetales bacterium]